jgi:PfaD family protein
MRVSHDPAGVLEVLTDLERPVFIVRTPRGIGASHGGIADASGEHQVLAAAPPLPPERLGAPAFAAAHRTRYAYMGGAMANGIASAEVVIELARAGCLGSFGAAGLLPERIERALERFAAEIPGLPFACNLIHSPHEAALERGAVELYLRHGVRCVEASAFMDVTAHIVRYRVAGLEPGPDGQLLARNRVIAKVSREEVAERFMRPAPPAIVAALLADGLITETQAELATRVPLAADITVEADSGGHTDRRPLPALLPAILRLADRIGREQRYADALRVGAGGGIGTPEAAWGAFAMGAAYIVTGSVNQSCVESGASEHTKALLARAGVADCAMAPAADMFELGVELQVLRQGTLFPMRAKRLYELYRTYDGIEPIPADERAKLEAQVFRRNLDDVWEETVAYFERRDPEQIERARGNAKRRMALVFRWYLGMSSRWSNVGDPDRRMDYQIWCGPAMGSFNDWVRGSHLEPPAGRRVADVAHQLLRGAAVAARAAQLRSAGVSLPASATDYRPLAPAAALVEAA